MKRDFSSLKAQLLASARRYVPEWLPGGKACGNEWRVGSLTGEPGKSLSINMDTGVWKDFATEETGGDLIDLYMAIHDVDAVTAYKLLNGDSLERAPRPMAPRIPATPPPPARKVITPVPESVNLHECVHPVFGRPSRTWQYQDEEGLLLGYVARYDREDGKEIVPWTYTPDGWGMGQWPEPRPLYGLQHLASRPDDWVLLVEGEKSTDAAVQFAGRAYVVVTWPGGGQAWKKADFTPLYGRKVLLWPDADLSRPGNAKIAEKLGIAETDVMPQEHQPGWKTMQAIAGMLAPHCPELKFIDPGHDLTREHGWDAADSGFTWAEFKEWAIPRVSIYTPPPTPEVTAMPVKHLPSVVPRARLNEDIFIFSATPLETASVFQKSLPDDGKVLFWRGEFYTWNGHRYVVRDAVYLHQMLYHFMSSCLTYKNNPKTGDSEVVSFSPNKAHIENVMHALRAVCFVNLPEPPSWITEEPGDVPAGEIIAFRNGFLHARTRRLFPSTPRLFITGSLDFDYDPSAPAPRAWLTFLNTMWENDKDSIRALSEMFGYLLTDDTSLQKAFLLIGPPRCGKGTILRVLENMVGQHNRASPSLAGIGTQFGLQPLIGKRVAMVSDARLSGKQDQQPIVENILRITGEDAITLDRKHTTAWSGKLSSRFVMASNETPSFSDASTALANRFVMFKFTVSYLGREDPGLTSRLLPELPGIILWALDGLANLQARGHFISPESSRELAEEMIEQSSPISAFVAEKCVVHPDAAVDRNDLFAVWKTWCQSQGMEHPGTMVTFGRRLSAAFPSIGRSQPRDSGTRLNMYTGIRLQRIFDQSD